MHEGPRKRKLPTIRPLHWEQAGRFAGVLGQLAGGTLVFAGDKEEPLLGVTVLESVGFWIDPQRDQLMPRPPKRKCGA